MKKLSYINMSEAQLKVECSRLKANLSRATLSRNKALIRDLELKIKNIEFHICAWSVARSGFSTYHRGVEYETIGSRYRRTIYY